jgi:hypothetical protein
MTRNERTERARRAERASRIEKAAREMLLAFEDYEHSEDAMEYAKKAIRDLRAALDPFK